MNKTIAALTLGAALAVSGAAFAQQADATKDGPKTEQGRYGQDRAKPNRMSPDDKAALMDARLAGLKTGLKLNADQEKLWPAVETALRASAKDRAERMGKFKEERKEAREDGKKGDYIERLRMGADMATERATEMRKLADAVEPLYKTLDDGQKRRLGMLLKAGGPEHHKGHHHGGPRGDHRR